MCKVFQARRDYIYERMNSIKGVSCIKPEGAFYVMMNVSELLGKTLHGHLITSDSDFASAFLEESMVAVVPCAGFGTPNYVRWTYATSMETVSYTHLCCIASQLAFCSWTGCAVVQRAK